MRRARLQPGMPCFIVLAKAAGWYHAMLATANGLLDGDTGTIHIREAASQLTTCQGFTSCGVSIHCSVVQFDAAYLRLVPTVSAEFPLSFPLSKRIVNISTQSCLQVGPKLEVSRMAFLAQNDKTRVSAKRQTMQATPR